MKIIIDLEAVEPEKQERLMSTLKHEKIPFFETEEEEPDEEEEWTPEEIEEHNREIDEAEAQFERGEYYTHEQVKEEIKKWFEK